MSEEVKEEVKEEAAVEAPTAEEIKSVSNTVKELREIVGSKDANTAESLEKIKKMESELESFEKKNEALVSEMAKSRKSEEEVTKRIANLESLIVKNEGGQFNDKEAKRKANLILNELAAKSSLDLFSSEAKEAYSELVNSRKDMRTDSQSFFFYRLNN